MTPNKTTKHKKTTKQASPLGPVRIRSFDVLDDQSSGPYFAVEYELTNGDRYTTNGTTFENFKSANDLVTSLPRTQLLWRPFTPRRGWSGDVFS